MATTEVLETRDSAGNAGRVLDTCGLLCPYPYIRAKQALDALPSGASLEILTDSEPTALSSVPILCQQYGYTYTTTVEGEKWRLVVTKG